MSELLTVKQFKNNLLNLKNELKKSRNITTASKVVSYLMSVADKKPNYNDYNMNVISKNLHDFLLNYDGGMIFDKESVIDFTEQDAQEENTDEDTKRSMPSTITKIKNLPTNWIDEVNLEPEPVSVQTAFDMIKISLKALKKPAILTQC